MQCEAAGSMHDLAVTLEAMQGVAVRAASALEAAGQGAPSVDGMDWSEADATTEAWQVSTGERRLRDALYAFGAPLGAPDLGITLAP